MSARQTSLPRIIILGCGYVGRALAETVIARGWTVEALTRNVEKARELRALGIGVIESDLASDAWHAALNPVGAWIVDSVSSGRGGVAGYRHSYQRGAESIVKWIWNRGAPVGLIYTGSTSVYAQSGREWVDETSSAVAGTASAEVLLATENTFREAVADGILPRVALVRLAGIYGPGRHYLIDRLRAGDNAFAGSGEHYLNLIHRDDAAGALTNLIERWNGAGTEVFNCADGRPSSKAEVAEWTARQLGVAPPVFHPGQRSDRTKRRELASGGVPNRRIRADKLRTFTGWAPRYGDFRAGYSALLSATEGDGGMANERE